MNGSQQSRHRRFLPLLASVVVALIVVPAAAGGAAEGTSSAHDVAEGLKKIQSIAVDIAAYSGKDKAKAAELAESIEDVWKPIEDTLRGNDKDAYIAFEDAFEALGAAAKAGDASKAGKAAHAVETAVSAYLAKYPDAPAAKASAGTSTGAPVPDAAPGPAAKPAPDANSTAGRSADAAAPAPAAPAPSAAAAAPAPDAKAAAAAEPGDATLARTGPMTGALAALAGVAFLLGGLAVIGGARRRTAPLA